MTAPPFILSPVSLTEYACESPLGQVGEPSISTSDGGWSLMG